MARAKLLDELKELVRKAGDPSVDAIEREDAKKTSKGVAAQLRAIDKEMHPPKVRGGPRIDPHVVARQKILDEIGLKVKEIAEVRSLDIVIDVSARSKGGFPIFIPTADFRDLTDEAIKKLNSGLGSLDSEQRHR